MVFHRTNIDPIGSNKKGICWTVFNSSIGSVEELLLFMNYMEDCQRLMTLLWQKTVFKGGGGPKISSFFCWLKVWFSTVGWFQKPEKVNTHTNKQTDRRTLQLDDWIFLGVDTIGIKQNLPVLYLVLQVREFFTVEHVIVFGRCLKTSLL